MKRNKLTILLAVLMSTIGIKAYAYDFEVDGIYYNIVSASDRTCEVTYNNPPDYSGEVMIPDAVQFNGRELKVIGVGKSAFRKCSVTSVILPEGIKYIGESAFSDSSFETISIPTTLKTVGMYAFIRAEIKRVDISDIKSWCEIEYEYKEGSSYSGTFRGTSTPFITIESIENTNYSPACTITEAALYLNGNICYDVELPKGVKVGPFAFAGTSIRNIILPEGPETIFFVCCKKLESVTTPSSLGSIPMNAFYGCSKLSKVQLAEGLQGIRQHAFSNCPALKSIVFPSSLKYLNSYIFGRENLPEELYLEIKYSENRLNLPYRSLKGVTSINIQRSVYPLASVDNNGNVLDRGLFDSHLKKVVIGSRVDSIPLYLFYNCEIDSLEIQDGNNKLYIEMNKYQPSEFCQKGIRSLRIGRYLENYPYKSGWFFIYDYVSPVKKIIVGDSIMDMRFLSEINAKVRKKTPTDKTNYSEEYQAYDLESIIIGKSVNNIPLMLQENMDSIIVRNSTPPVAEGFSGKAYLYTTLYVPKGCKEKYEVASVWKDFWNIEEMEQDVTDLKTEAVSKANNTGKISYYSISGLKRDSPQKGINIIKNSDGKVRKVIIK